MGTIGASNQPIKETPNMAARTIYIPYTMLEKEFDLIASALHPVIEAVEQVAATHGKLKLPLTFLQPDEHEDNASRLVHAALLKLDETKESITYEQWKQYDERYTTFGNRTQNQAANRKCHFKPEMSELVNSIAEYIRKTDAPVRAYWGSEPSPRAVGTIAVIHTAKWLEQQEQEKQGES